MSEKMEEEHKLDYRVSLESMLALESELKCSIW